MQSDPTSEQYTEREVLRDRVAHAIQFGEETLRALREALERLDGEQS